MLAGPDLAALLLTLHLPRLLAHRYFSQQGTLEAGPYHLGISRAGVGLPFKYTNGSLAVQATSNVPYGHWVYFAGGQQGLQLRPWTSSAVSPARC